MASQSTVNVERRNIVVLGKTGCGKSTVANKFVDSPGNDLFPIGRSLEGVTEHPSLREARTTVNGVEYNIKVIDTVGLFDSSRRNNKAVLVETKTFFKQNVTGLNLILFVFREGRYTEEEKKTFSLLTKHFRRESVGEISALVVTNCENLNEAERDKVVEDLKKNETTGPICEFMQRGILTVGFPDLTKANPKVVSIFAESAAEDQLELRKLVCSCDKVLLNEELLSDSFWERVERTLCNIHCYSE